MIDVEELKLSLQDYLTSRQNQLIDIKLRSLERRKFKPLADTTIELKGHDKPLIDGGELMKSFTTNIAITPTGIKITIDNSTEYAKYHNTGFVPKYLKTGSGAIVLNAQKHKTPARPWWFDENLDSEEIKEISELVQQGIEEILNV